MVGVVEMGATIGHPSQSPCCGLPVPPEPAEDWVLGALEPDQLVQAKDEHFGRASLGPWTRVLMWGLRGYVLFMMVVVGYRVWTTVHPGA